MINRIWRIYHAEMSKAVRTKSCIVGPLLVVFATVVPILFYAKQASDTNGYALIALATPFAMGTFGFLATLIFNASLITSEYQAGTLRHVLVRPVLRHEFIFGKLLFGLSYGLLLLLLTAISAWTCVALLKELNGITYGGELLFSHGEMLYAYLVGIIFAIPPIAAGAAFALMVSSLTKSSGSAIAVSLSSWILVDILKYPLRIEDYIFTTYLDAPWENFASQCDGISLGWQSFTISGLCVCIGTFFITTLIAVLSLWQRNMR